jgi:HEAT repeat protein
MPVLLKRKLKENIIRTLRNFVGFEHRKNQDRLLILFSLTVIFFLAGCAGSKVALNEQSHGNGVSVEECIEQFPAENNTMQYVLSKNLFQMGSDSLNKLILKLNNAVAEHLVKIEYAISGVVSYGTHPDTPESHWKMIQKTILNSYHSIEDPAQHRFLLDQLYRSADESTISFLGSVLEDAEVTGSAIRVLTAIGSEEAGQVLLASLKNGTTNPEATIQALGDMNYKPAAGKLMEIGMESDKKVRMIAIDALIRMGIPDVIRALRRGTLDEGERNTLILRLAGTLENQRSKQKAFSLYDSLYADTTLSISTRIVALNGLLNQQNTKSVEILENAISNRDSRIFKTALNRAETLQWEGITDLLLKNLDRVQPNRKTALLRTLEARKDSLALTKVVELSHHEYLEVRLKAMEALLAINRTRYLETLPDYLRNTLSAEEKRGIIDQLMHLTEKELVSFTEDNYLSVPVESKKILLRACSARPLKGLKSFYWQIINENTPELQKNAVRALTPVVEEEDTEHLFAILETEQGRTDHSLLWPLMTRIVQQSPRPRNILTQMDKIYQAYPDSMKAETLTLYRQIGGPDALNYVVQALNTDKTLLRKSAVRILGRWPDDSALDPLLNHIRTTNELKEKVICIRGMIRLLQSPEIPDVRVVYYLSRLAKMDLRKEEKNLLISALSKRRIPESLSIIAGFLSDEAVSEEAYAAVMEISKTGDKKVLSGTEISGELLLTLGPPNLKSRLEDPMLSVYADSVTPPEGFEILFNGRNLKGWKGLVADPVARSEMTPEELQQAQQEADREMRKHWHVIDGILFFDGKGQSLCTAKNYRNFELLVDWKIEKGGDSGIYLRATPQVQIWDPVQHPGIRWPFQQ